MRFDQIDLSTSSFTSRHRGEVGLRSYPGEGALLSRDRNHLDPSPLAKGEGACFRCRYGSI